jgi:two-component system sensor histidine kinase/response regulator
VFRESSAIERAGLVAAVEQAADGIVITDTQGIIQYVNPAFTTLTGYTKEEAAGQNPRILKSGCHPMAHYEDLWNTIRSGRVWHGEVINRRKDGSLYHEEMRINPVRDSLGGIVSYIAIKRDVTQRRAQENAQAFLAAIVESSEDAIVAYTPAGAILTWNHGAEAVFGYSAGEAIGKHISMLPPPERRQALEDLTKQILRGDVVPHYEGLGLRQDGRRIHVWVAGSPVKNAAGEVVALSAVIRDITERKVAEQDRALLASIVESSEDAIYAVSPDGTIVSWNRGAEALFGYSSREIIGKSVATLVPLDRVDEVRQLFGAIGNGRAIPPFEKVLATKNGSDVDVSISISPIRNAAGDVVGASAIVRDIGERLRAERKLRESEERFREVFEHAPSGLSVTAPDGRFLQVNAALCRMLGYSAKELLETSWTKLTHPDDLELCQGKVDRLLKEPEICPEWEKRYIHRSGTVVWARIKMSLVGGSGGNPPYFVVHMEDITERKRAEEALRESEERFRIMADGCPAPMWVTDAGGGNQFINRAYRELCGTTYEEVAGLKWQLLIHPDDAREYVESFQRAVRERLPFKAELRVRRADGEWRWLASHAEPRLSPGGEYLGHVGLSPDITERKRAEEALRESEERFRIMADGCPAPMWVTDAEGGIQFVNRVFREFCGDTYEQVEGRKWPLVIHPDDEARHVEAFQRAVREHTPFQLEFLARRADGEWRWVNSYGEPRLAPDGEYLGHVGLSPDITERKQAEEALWVIQERYRLLAHALESADECISITDIEDRILYVNGAFFRTYGYREHELIGQHIGILRSARTPEEIQTGILPATMGGKWCGELWNRTKEGREFPISLSTSVVYDEDGRRIALVGIASDITERKRAEQALRSSEEKFRQLAENVREVFWMTSPAAGEILYVSPAYEQVWGKTCESLHRNPMSWEEAIHPDDREQVRVSAARQLRGEPVESEYRIQTPGGQEKWIRNRAFPIRDQSGQLIRVVGIAEEITERKRYEEELIRAREAADTANLAKSRFLANMSHEIRTPMNGVIGMVQLLLDTDLTPEQRRFTSVVQTSGRALLALIDDILDVSKIEAGKITLESRSFDLRYTMENVAQILGVQAKAKGLEFHARVSPDIPPLRGDAHRLRQVLTNLAANAIKFTERGEVTVEAVLQGHRDGKTTVYFKIADTGIGIRSDQTAALFQPFAQADASTTRKYGGTGLGLAISKQLVERMGGTIGVRSQEGQGSVFWFTAVFEPVPNQGQPAGKRGDEGCGAPGGPARTWCGLRILVAEDNPVNREVALAQLRKLGYQANAVVNGARAVEAVESGGYDLVLMDCQMPVMDGLEATLHIRASNHPDIPIIAITADAMPADQERCLKEGMNDYLAKPVELEQLAGVLAKWLPAGSGTAAAPIPKGHAVDPENAVFNEAALLRRLIGDRQLAGVILKGFLADVPSRLNSLRQRIEAADGPGAQSQAHTLKGSAATVSAEGLQALAQAMERAGTAGQLDRCGELLPRAVDEFERFKSTLESAGWV